VDGIVATLGPLEKVQTASGDDKKKVIGGAIAGAVLGRIFGGSTKSTVIGAAAGAAAGTAAAHVTRATDACLPVGSALRLTISREIVVPSSAL
jgi:outer membrane lipoprotein SlyB